MKLKIKEPRKKDEAIFEKMSQNKEIFFNELKKLNSTEKLYSLNVLIYSAYHIYNLVESFYLIKSKNPKEKIERIGELIEDFYNSPAGEEVKSPMSGQLL